MGDIVNGAAMATQLKIELIDEQLAINSNTHISKVHVQRLSYVAVSAMKNTYEYYVKVGSVPGGNTHKWHSKAKFYSYFFIKLAHKLSIKCHKCKIRIFPIL